MERISIDKSKLIEKFNLIRHILKEEGEIEIKKLAKRINASVPTCREWVSYLIDIQKEQKIIMIKDNVTTLQYHDTRLYEEPVNEV